MHPTTSMSPFMVVGMIILAVLLSDTILRASTFVQTWVYTKVTHRHTLPSPPASVDEVFELLKVIADRQTGIIEGIASLRKLQGRAEEITALLDTTIPVAHKAQIDMLESLVRKDDAILGILMSIEPRLK